MVTLGLKGIWGLGFRKNKESTSHGTQWSMKWNLGCYRVVYIHIYIYVPVCNVAGTLWMLVR